MAAVITEIRYRNGPGFSPADDYVEIRVPVGADVSNISIEIYNTTGSLRSQTALTPGAPTTVGAFDFYVINAPINRFGAVALVENGTVASFVSFDDAVTATQGAAAGLTSVQVGSNGRDSTSSLSSQDGSTFVVDPNPAPGAAPPCFAAGTLIATPGGLRRVEHIAPDDMVLVSDGDRAPLRLSLARRFRAGEMRARPALRPVRIRAGALGPGTPRRDLVVSRQHRILVSSKIAWRMFGVSDVLVPAIRLVGLPGVEIEGNWEEVTYFHLVFDRHEVIFAEGAPTESLYLGPGALQTLSAAAQAEVLEIFPDFDFAEPPLPARYIPPGPALRRLVERHARNSKPLLNAAASGIAVSAR